MGECGLSTAVSDIYKSVPAFVKDQLRAAGELSTVSGALAYFKRNGKAVGISTVYGNKNKLVQLVMRDKTCSPGEAAEYAGGYCTGPWVPMKLWLEVARSIGEQEAAAEAKREAETHEKDVYCICHSKCTGDEMAACDNEQCPDPDEWYHFQCVDNPDPQPEE
jgi:hypothetical protein